MVVLRDDSRGAGAPAKTVILAQQWRRYKRTGDQEIRDQLILAYSPLVKYHAGRMASGMPTHVDVADLISYGLGGLIDAVERYDPALGVPFEAFARTRIRGAVYDQLRSQDWVPRRVRHEAKAIRQATAELCTRFQRAPTEAELAAELSLTAEQLGAALVRVDTMHVVALDERAYRGGEGQEGNASLLDVLADPDAEDPEAIAQQDDLRDRVAAAVALLPAQEQTVLGLRYHQHMSLTEVGEVLSLSGARVSQLQAKAIIGLRALIPAPPGHHGPRPTGS